MRVNRRSLIAGLAALAAAVPVAASAGPLNESGQSASSHSAAVRTCVDFRQQVGHEAFSTMFRNLLDCARNVAS